MNILEILPTGAENATTQTELATMFNCSKRELRAAIFEARRHGAVILSSPNGVNGGYYLPKNNSEIRRYIAFQDSRINSATVAKRPAEELLKRGGISGTDER